MFLSKLQQRILYYFVGKGKYQCTANLLVDWFELNQICKSVFKIHYKSS